MYAQWHVSFDRNYWRHHIGLQIRKCFVCAQSFTTTLSYQDLAKKVTSLAGNIQDNGDTVKIYFAFVYKFHILTQISWMTDKPGNDASSTLALCLQTIGTFKLKEHVCLRLSSPEKYNSISCSADVEKWQTFIFKWQSPLVFIRIMTLACWDKRTKWLDVLIEPQNPQIEEVGVDKWH